MNKCKNPIMEVFNGIAGIFLCFAIGGGIAFAMKLAGDGMDYFSSDSLLYSSVVIVISLCLQLFFRVRVETMFVIANFFAPFFVMITGLGLAKIFLNMAIENGNFDKNNPLFVMDELVKIEIVPLFPYLLSSMYLLIVIFNILVLKKNIEVKNKVFK